MIEPRKRRAKGTITPEQRKADMAARVKRSRATRLAVLLPIEVIRILDALCEERGVANRPAMLRSLIVDSATNDHAIWDKLTQPNGYSLKTR